MIDHIATSRVLLKAAVVLSCLLVPAMGPGAVEAAPVGQAGAEAESGKAAAEASRAEAGAPADGDGSAAQSADSHEGEHHETGVPINFKGDLALWSLVTFLLFLVVLKKFAWGPMIQGLDQREAGIRKAIADADENRRKSEASTLR